MVEQLLQIATKAIAKQKTYILNLEDSFKNYMTNTDSKIEMLSQSNSLRDKFISEKVDKFLSEIPLPKDADNEYILAELNKEAKKYFEELGDEVDTITSESLSNIQYTTEKSLKEIDDKLEAFMSQKLDEYRAVHYKAVKEAIKTQLARLPKPKDGKDAEVDYKIITKQIQKEIKETKSVKDIDVEKNDLKITYTDGTKKKVSLPKQNIVINGGGAVDYRILGVPKVLTATQSITLQEESVIILVDATSQNITVTLSKAENCYFSSRSYAIGISRIDTSISREVTIQTDGQEKILFEDSIKLLSGEVVNLITDGKNWYLGA